MTLSAVLAGRPATGQDTRAEPRAVTPSAWEIELHGGASVTRGSSDGTAGLPQSGVLVGGLIGVSSFYFGDGARLFNQNQVAGAGGQAAPTIVPLDPVLRGSGLDRPLGATFGLRVGRRINRRLAVDIVADYHRSTVSFTPEARAGIEATRASFTPALERVLSRSPLATTVSSTAAITDEQQAPQLLTTGALVVMLRTAGRVIPYLSAGGGVMVNRGETPRATLTGNYTIGDPPRLLGTDLVRLRYANDGRTLVWTGGGGVKYLAARRWGVRFDARAYVYEDATLTLVDAAPDRTLASTGEPFPVINAGALQFSAIAPLTGGPIAGGTTFAGSGMRAHVALTAGFFLRF